MGIFSKATPKPNDLVQEPRPPSEYPLRLEQMAKEAEPAALERRDEIYAAAIAEHEKDVAGYGFECRRWGDFLSLFIRRDGNVESRYGSGPGRKYATSVNLAATREIKLIEGRPADLDGVLGYYVVSVGDDGSTWHGGGWDDPSPGRHYEVRCQDIYIPEARWMFELAPPSPLESQIVHSYGGGYQIAYTTKAYARPAKDDAIHFRGIDATVFAPAGRGQKVYDDILAEIARGAAPTPKPKGRKK